VQSISLAYLAGLMADVSKLTLIVLVTVVALFLSDVIVSSFLPSLLAHGAQLKSIFLIFLYASPNGLFIALPVALLIGVYIVVLRRREQNEFQVLQGLGGV
jgi:lipopolysaccharide export LptBFGC system permease protein LptF